MSSISSFIIFFLFLPFNNYYYQDFSRSDISEFSVPLWLIVLKAIDFFYLRTSSMTLPLSSKPYNGTLRSKTSVLNLAPFFQTFPTDSEHLNFASVRFVYASSQYMFILLSWLRLFLSFPNIYHPPGPSSKMPSSNKDLFQLPIFLLLLWMLTIFIENTFHTW